MYHTRFFSLCTMYCFTSFPKTDLKSPRGLLIRKPKKKFLEYTGCPPSFLHPLMLIRPLPPCSSYFWQHNKIFGYSSHFAQNGLLWKLRRGRGGRGWKKVEEGKTMVGSLLYICRKWLHYTRRGVHCSLLSVFRFTGGEGDSPGLPGLEILFQTDL